MGFSSPGVMWLSVASDGNCLSLVSVLGNAGCRSVIKILPCFCLGPGSGDKAEPFALHILQNF